ncbi:hypothetical protein GCM10011491_42810 [Brucella endophytica]|uniref:Uncharacterized protein n=1 Tax=Brucella endophytica TaxID=1963359 RepID=A0A916SPU8_9HYPH|nr:hypothetical protein GCM10011491_42810 [Brucella endophytica]
MLVMKEQIADRTTTAIATGAAMNWIWLPYLEHVLSIALSALGVIWLLVQIYYKVRSGR